MVIDGGTRLMGVIGDPIAQIRTPEAINPIFARAGANILCVPVHVTASGLGAAISGLREMRNVIGFGITLPHKEAMLELCDSLDPAAESVGAVNVVRRETDGSFRGYQFDGPGFVGGLKAAGHDPAGRDCLVVGAGGAARAIVLALLQAGALRVGVANRTAARAEALAAAVNAALGDNRAAVVAARPLPGQLVVNATSLGLSPSDPLPVDPDLLDASMTVAEVIAKPETTRLLQEAARRGAGVHSGMRMIEHQVGLIAEHMLALHRP